MHNKIASRRTLQKHCEARQEDTVIRNRIPYVDTTQLTPDGVFTMRDMGDQKVFLRYSGFLHCLTQGLFSLALKETTRKQKGGFDCGEGGMFKAKLWFEGQRVLKKSPFRFF